MLMALSKLLRLPLQRFHTTDDKQLPYILFSVYKTALVMFSACQLHCMRVCHVCQTSSFAQKLNMQTCCPVFCIHLMSC